MGRDLDDDERKSGEERRGPCNYIIGPAIIAENSSAIFAAYFPESDVELRKLRIQSKLPHGARVLRLEFKHRELSESEKTEKQHCEDVLHQFIRDFYESHGWALCATCRAFGCQEGCTQFATARRRPISKSAMEAYEIKHRELSRRSTDIYLRTQTTVFELDEHADMDRAFVGGERNIHGFVERGHMLHLLVSNRSRDAFEFNASIVAHRM